MVQQCIALYKTAESQHYYVVRQMDTNFISVVQYFGLVASEGMYCTCSGLFLDDKHLFFWQDYYLSEH